MRLLFCTFTLEKDYFTMKENEKLFLLDAYALIYRAYYAFIKSPRINSKGLNTSAILGFVNTLEEVLRKENPTHIGVAFDPKGPTFRHEAFPAYKAQREETPEGIREAIPYIKQILEAYHIPILEVAGYEADDVIGTIAKKSGEMGLKTYMMTPDKDYGQLVESNVFMYRPKYGDKEFEILGPDEIAKKYDISSPLKVIDLLGLMGDASDNIPGCPGVGEKTAVKLIHEFGNIENLLANTNQLKGALQKKVEENAEQIRFSKFLATIKTDVPIDFNPSELLREAPDQKKLRALFDELEFRNLSERIFKALKSENSEDLKEDSSTLPTSISKKRGNNSKGEVTAQLDLFSESAYSDTETIQTSLFKVDEIAENASNGTEENKYAILTQLKDLQTEYHLVDNQEKRLQFLQKIRTSEIISLDTETTGINPITAELVGMSFSIKENEAFYLPVPPSREEALLIVNEIKEVFENKNSLKIGQNLKYDLLVLENYGVKLQGPLFDTMIAHYILQPEWRHGMDFLAEVYLKYRTIHIEELIGEKGKTQKNMRDLNPEDVYQYACEDADVTLKLYHVLLKGLKEQDVYELCKDVEMPLLPVLARMERNGVRIDTESLKITSKKYAIRLKDLEQQIYTLAEGEFNISSPKQVGEILFDKLKLDPKAKKTKSGQYATSEDTLEKLRMKHEIVERILDYRGLKKLLSTYIEALPKLINPATNRIHTSFNQTVTATGRLSSSNPNLQNIPIRDEDGKEIRKAFIPNDGQLFFSADYSQIELRIMAHLSEDEHMIEAFRSGADIHAATASNIYKVPLEEVTKDMRRKAKTANFGIIYGISTFGLAERMGVDRKEAKELIDNYFITYPKIKSYMEKSIQFAREHEYVETLFQRRRYLPDINSKNAIVRGYAERNAINAPIQGSAADLIKVAMSHVQQRLDAEGLKTQMILQVHDELNFSVPVDEKEKVEQIVLESMQEVYPLHVPLVADCGWGANWLEAH